MFNKEEFYVYSKLATPDTIRILSLEPSSIRSVALSCSLSTRMLTEYGTDLLDQYIALSYVWGSCEESETILIDDQSLCIKKNLADILRKLRDSRRIVTLWIDAICINQLDTDERNNQVLLMREIYSIAKHTIIYLGSSNESTDQFFKHILSLQRLGQQWYAEASNNEDNPLNSAMSTGAQDLYSAARGLTLRPWFNRVWVS